MEVDGAVASAARRRRERRLRSWWKHEQQTVRMVLSAAAHHSFDKVAAGETFKRPTGTEDGQGPQRGGGARVARRAAAPEASSTGDAASTIG